VTPRAMFSGASRPTEPQWPALAQHLGRSFGHVVHAVLLLDQVHFPVPPFDRRQSVGHVGRESLAAGSLLLFVSFQVSERAGGAKASAAAILMAANRSVPHGSGRGARRSTDQQKQRLDKRWPTLKPFSATSRALRSRFCAIC
jgi:hypothetical protein